MTRPDATSWRRAVLTIPPRSPFTGPRPDAPGGRGPVLPIPPGPPFTAPRPDRSFRIATRRLSNLDSDKPNRARISRLICPERQGEFDIAGSYQNADLDARTACVDEP